MVEEKIPFHELYSSNLDYDDESDERSDDSEISSVEEEEEEEDGFTRLGHI